MRPLSIRMPFGQLCAYLAMGFFGVWRVFCKVTDSPCSVLGVFQCAEVPGGVSLACVDEAHCVSEWSHNFRPAYYRLGSLLRSGVGMGCILGLTATATRITRNTVADSLGIPPEGVMVDAPMRSNLRCGADSIWAIGSRQC